MNAQQERLARALSAAHAAGDVEGASKLAQALRATQGQPAQEPETVEAPARSTLQELGRQVGLAGRYTLEGGLALPGMLANIPAGVGNVGLKVADKVAEQFGGNVDFRFQDQNQNISQGLTQLGFPQPETRGEERVANMSRAVAGAGSGAGLGKTLAANASPVIAGLGQQLQSRPLLQGVSAVTGARAADVAEDAGAGPWSQFAAGLGGAAVPGLVGSGAPMLTRAGFRGGEPGRQRVEENIKAFERAGTTPSVGQATESRFARSVEGLMSRTPGGAGPMVAKAASQADDISAMLDQRASQLVRKTSAEQAGRRIQKSITGEGGFVDSFKAKQGQLFDELDKFLPADSRVDVAKTKSTLESLNVQIPGAPNVSKFFQNARIRDIARAFNDDLSDPQAFLTRPDVPDATKDVVRAALEKAGANINHPTVSSRATGVVGKPQQIGLDSAEAQELLGQISDGKLPYEALKKLRTLVGNELSDATIASDVPRSKWKALYGALSEDLKGAADSAGPDAQAAWSRANNYTRAGMRRIETIESVVEKNGGPESIFRAATSNTKEGATTLRAVMQSLDKDGQKMVTATVLRRLGLAKAGVQGDLGDQFSTETFLTNWNLLSPEAKRALFDRHGPQFRSDMDQVAKVAANLREGSQVFRNPSGTGQATTQAATVATFALSVITGNVGTAGAVASGVGGANLTARLMTNPRFVRWLAQSTKHPLVHKPAMINRLAQRVDGDEDIARAVALLEHQAGDQKQNDNRGQQNQ